jgi:TFIIH p62 subunit, N-terminal domain
VQIVAAILYKHLDHSLHIDSKSHDLSALSILADTTTQSYIQDFLLWTTTPTPKHVPGSHLTMAQATYANHFSKEQVNCIKNLPTSEENVHKMLLLHYDLNTPIDVARQMIKDERESQFCPICRKDLTTIEAQRLKRRHINKCGKEFAIEETWKKSRSNPANDTTESAPNQDETASPTPSDSSTSTQSSLPTSATSSSSSSLRSPSKSPKRKLDDADGPSSGDEDLKLNTDLKEAAAGPPESYSIAKRPKITEHCGSNTITSLASYKGRDGTIHISENQTFLQWCGHDKPTNRATMPTSSITNLQQSKAGSKHRAAPKLHVQGLEDGESTNYLFNFTFPANAEREAGIIKEALNPFVQQRREAQKMAAARKRAEVESRPLAEVSPPVHAEPSMLFSAASTPTPKNIDYSKYISEELESDIDEDEEGYWDKLEASFDDEEPEMITKESQARNSSPVLLK